MDNKQETDEFIASIERRARPDYAELVQKGADVSETERLARLRAIDWQEVIAAAKVIQLLIEYVEQAERRP
jgi:hypothetical protein